MATLNKLSRDGQAPGWCRSHFGSSTRTAATLGWAGAMGRRDQCSRAGSEVLALGLVLAFMAYEGCGVGAAWALGHRSGRSLRRVFVGMSRAPRRNSAGYAEQGGLEDLQLRQSDLGEDLLKDVMEDESPNTWDNLEFEGQWPTRDFLLSPKQPRHYQEQAVDFFFQHARPTGHGIQGRPLKMRLVCGSGKTFIYGLLITRDLMHHPASQSVVFVPWRDLARQVAAELEGFGLRTCVVGDGDPWVDDTANVVICVFASVHRLTGRTFRIKIVDEAHHLISSSSSGRSWDHTIHHSIGATLEADFSATFRDQDVDFDYGFDQALSEGFICNLKAQICLISGNQSARLATLARLVQQNSELWAPMFIMFNTVSVAKIFAERLNELGVPARAMEGTDSRKVRTEVNEKLRKGSLSALCLVKLFNEGTSIDELRTVVMAEPRQSSVNIQQVAMRVLRTHSSKPSGFGCFVQAIDLSPWIVDDSDLKNFVLGLTSTKELRLLRSKTVHDDPWVRRQIRRPGVLQDTVRDDALQFEGSSSLVSVRVFDRLGRELSEDKDPDWLLKSRLAELTAWQQNHGGGLPCTNSSEEEEVCLARWLEAVVAKAASGSLPQEAVQSLKALSGLSLGEDTSAAKLRALLSLQSWIQDHQRCPSWASTEPSELLQYQRLQFWRGRFLGGRRSKKLTHEELQLLEAEPLLHRYVTMPPRPSPIAAISALVSWVQANQRLPKRSATEPFERLLGLATEAFA
ncbi:unnamed protein product [Polarella glacialis]|uniref:Helicase ATP-binding domain-containing protein n=1 Tax=Polarella glacialis TaxID=89957 RepID=A0A813FP78_POLGL|nr:unnamed protein product [Polarella glacialis]